MSDAICKDCGVELDPGTAKVFTVCDTCWDKAYPPRTPVGEPAPKGAATPAPVLDETAQCMDQGPNGWLCCLPLGHEGDHVTTWGNPAALTPEEPR